MKTQAHYTISEMNKKQVEEIPIQWAKNEGWNPGLNDIDPFYAQNPHGFFMGCLDEVPIGCCSATIYDQSFAFFGFYIVKAEYRHQGYGIQMTRRRLEYAGDRNIGLDGVLTMTDKYANIGFRTAHMNIRYQGKVVVKPKKETNLFSVSNSLFSQVEQYDRLYFPAPRHPFLQEWLKPAETRASLAYIYEGKIKGYGVIRKCFTGYKIGPLFADSFEIADILFQGLATKAQGEMVILDIPEPNLFAMQLVKRYNMEESFKTLRMYTKKSPDINLDNVFGITTFEFG